MGKSNELSRRERQIMDILFANSEGTVKQIQAELPGAPTEMAVRRLLQILEEKGWLKRRKEGRAVVYSPKQSTRRAGINAFKHVLDTFFKGSVDEALAAHLSTREKVTPDELERLLGIIENAKSESKPKKRKSNDGGSK